jgi:hypothetical protein
LNSFSLLFKVSHEPSDFILSIVAILRIDFLVVWKFVNIPPDHLSVTKGILTLLIFSATMSLACFLVATKSTFFPDFAICFIAEQA